MSKSRGLDIVRTVVQQLLNTNTYGQCIRNVEFVSADNGNCVAEFTVGEEHLNFTGTLHGGCSTTLIDAVSTLGLMTTGDGRPGDSIDLHVIFLKPARLCDVVTIDSKTVKAGRTMAFLAVELSKKSDGAVVARGTHTKCMRAS